MVKKFRNLLNKIPEKRREKIESHTRQLVDEILVKNQNLRDKINDRSYQGNDS